MCSILIQVVDVMKQWRQWKWWRWSVYYVYVMRIDKLNGKLDAVTVISPPSCTSSETFFSRLGRVGSSSCGVAWK